MCYHEIRRYLYNCLLPLPRGTATRRGAARRHHLLCVTTDEKFPAAAFSVWNSFIAGVKRARAQSRDVPCDAAIMFQPVNDYRDRDG